MVGVLLQEEKLVSKGLANFLGSSLRVPLAELKARYDDGLCIGALEPEAFWLDVVDASWRATQSAFLASRHMHPRCRDVVQTLVEDGCVVAVISDMPREWATPLLRRVGIYEYLSAAVFSDDGRGSKREGTLFSALLADLHASPAEMLLVDDTPRNLDLVDTMGWETIYCPLPELTRAEQAKFRRIDDLTELPRVLRS